MRAEPAATLPDYRGGGIVNLMSSIVAALGGTPSSYPPLAAFAAAPLQDAKTIVLLVVDGLGYEYLCGAGAGSGLHRHLHSPLTSVFPSTTASAVTCLLTGLPPQQHGLTGWHMYYKEIGAIAAVLPLQPRHGGCSFRESGIEPATLLAGTSVFDRLEVETQVIAPANIVDSDFNSHYCGRARRSGYESLEQCFALIAAAIGARRGRSFIHAYYPKLDATAHAFGIASEQAARCFARLDAGIGALLKTIAGSDTALLVCADHGFIDSPPERLIELERHPDLAETLVLPLCGERRVAYCYVHPRRRQQFEAYVRGELADQASLMDSAELLERGWFGLGRPHPRLAERIGHYTLLMRDDWTIRDGLAGERSPVLIGVHGGVSAAEMLVPLILVTA